MFYCTACGEPLIKNAKFCHTCAAPVNDAVVPQPGSPAAVEAIRIIEQRRRKARLDSLDKRIAVTIVIFLIIGGGILLAHNYYVTVMLPEMKRNQEYQNCLAEQMLISNVNNQRAKLAKPCYR